LCGFEEDYPLVIEQEVLRSMLQEHLFGL